jgi:hypothetical protein
VPSAAFASHLHELLVEATRLDETSAQLPVGSSDRQARRAALSRAIVIACVSAWEAYIEELVRESLDLLRPAGPSLGVWPALNASVRGQLGRFNTPNVENVRLLLSDAVGLPDVHLSWAWSHCTPSQAVQRLTVAMDHRHRIAHGANPRPNVSRVYSSELPDFFRRLGRCTDRAVRLHFVEVHHIANPWPA